MKSLHHCALALALASAFTSAHAYDERSVRNSAGQEIFKVRFYGTADGEFDPIFSPGTPSTWNLSDAKKDKIVSAVSYWAEILRPKPGLPPAIVNVGTNFDFNAYGFSPTAGGSGDEEDDDDDDDLLYTLLNAQFNHENVPQEFLAAGAHGLFVMGELDYESDNYFVPSVISLTGKSELEPIAFHELAHGLGISSGIYNRSGSAPKLGQDLTIWDSFLRDDNGNPARPGQAILCEFCAPTSDPNPFDARRNQTYFEGPNVAQVLDGAMRGVPVTMYRTDVHGNITGLDSNSMSHLELRNSLMSHQPYRNYTNFMEAELAVLQDLGYSIDRRKFYGRSVYGNGLSIINTQGYFQRNADGTAYLPGQYSSTRMGIGLHVYGSHNHITQAADILSTGPGAVGMRVDGVGNTLVVDAGTRIHSNGYYGQGMLFAYGKNHQLVHRGDIQALGSQGVGLRFDFGRNALGSLGKDERGSYIFQRDGVDQPLLDELNGPLVSRADISGSVAGSRAAIYIGETAYVGHINILQGARLQGDIISVYDEEDDQGQQRLTRLSFGQKADTRGMASGSGDPSFSIRYNGNIIGPDNLSLWLDGGHTTLNGRHELAGVTIEQGATLSGTSSYTLATGTLFTNKGTLSPGNSPGSVQITGDYLQTATGRLYMEIDPSGARDTLVVSGQAILDGTLEVGLLPGWYSSNFQLTGVNFVQAGATVGDFSTLQATSNSPTLRFNATSIGAGNLNLSVNRPSNAYQRLGSTSSGRSTGAALDRIAAGTPAAAMEQLYQGLDFSAPDGSEVTRALEQLSPAGYSSVQSAFLRRERSLAMSALSDTWSYAQTTTGSAWTPYIAPYGGGGWQDTKESAAGYRAEEYGVLLGARRKLGNANAFTLGFQLDIAHQSIRSEDPYTARSKATSGGLGLHAAYGADRRTGLMTYAGMRIGLDRIHLDRSVSAGSYRALNSAQWTGTTGSVSLGATYQWALSPSVSVGPLLATNYARTHRPGTTESGSDASRLHLESAHADALRTSLGLQASLDTRLPDTGAHVSALAQITWDHELLGRDARNTASFVSQPGFNFTSQNAIVSRDSLGVRAALTYHSSDALQVGVELGGQLLGTGYESLSGKINVNWRF